MYNLLWTEHFSKKSKIFIQKHPEIKEKFRHVILLLGKDPFDNSLRTHKLKGKLSGL
ncbi:MAG: hypothetical protein JW982_00350 [Spirochaetes bacterium]|nr:hypothetical protein [Spirochaetota bacterium]